MAEYSKEEIKNIEEKWRNEWQKRNVYKVSNESSKPKYYVLDMFPYPSGAGLHVGHPLGYIASDIVARFKRVKGFNVLHPMGFDAFGLPAEQYALEHGIHPAISTADNINNFKRQLGKIGFCYDWSREVQTCDPSYYKWTQWIFLQIFDSWFNRKKEKAERISELISIFEREGNVNHPTPNSKFKIQNFSAVEWKGYAEKEQQEILMEYRLAYLAYTDVNWCEALGTVLANDEVINGVSYRGGFPVVKKQMRQWSLRITEYAERLLKGLDEIDFSDSMKDIQRNWIGKSVGARIDFKLLVNASLTPGPSPGERGFETSDKKFWPYLKDFAKENRQNPTDEEKILWEELRNSKLGHKIRRQHTIGVFIGDFVCLDKRLVIEVDGGYHLANKEFDHARTEFMKIEGFKVIRFTNEAVKNNLKKVLHSIKETLDKSPSIKASISLSPGEGRGEAYSTHSLERGPGGEVLTVFTTRPDTIFGVDFMVIAPEHELVKKITSPEQKEDIEKYLKYVESRSEVDRMAEVKKITGCFTGAYAINPFNGREIPVWISEYVLAGYGTGAIMAVPCGDERDHKFAKHFNIPITNIIGSHYNGEEANPTKDAILENSDFLNGIVMHKAIDVVANKLEEMGIGKRQVNYKMRDAGWSRQRYWGEPFPVVYKPALQAGRDDVPYAMKESELPLELPASNNFKPSGNGEGPLANLKDWINFSPMAKRDSNTMPTHAGAAWYFLRYMDPHNSNAFADPKALDYWNQVDVYIGGSEHAVAHLLYARLWTKVLHDLGYIKFDEPFKKLINQGKITGDSRFVYRAFVNWFSNEDKMPSPKVQPSIYVSAGIYENLQTEVPMAEKDIAKRSKAANIIEAQRSIINDRNRQNGNLLSGEFKISHDSFAPMHVDIKFVNGLELDTEAFKKWKPDFANAEFILEEDGKYICGSAIEKMSKSYFNVVNPDEIINNYGADTLRMYEMFLGPLEQSKPWNTSGIDGVFKFLRRVWNLAHDATGNFKVSEAEATPEELKALHTLIKKVEQDINNFSFNTSVSAFMICANELSSLKCNKRAVLEPLIICLSPFAPHIAEELWEKLGYKTSILEASYPEFKEEYLKENAFEYPISINGKVRAKMNFALDMPKEDIEKLVMASEIVMKWTEGKAPKKVIVVPGRIVNVVL